MEFELFFSVDEHSAIKVTPNLHRCFATQPPCTSMEVKSRCCWEDPEGLSREGGITIGDPDDTAKRVEAEHPNCPRMNAAFEEMNRYPIFRGMVRLSESHISRVEEVESDRAACEAAERRKKELKDAGWHVLWDAFQSAKENATLQNEQVRCPVFLSQNRLLRLLVMS